MALEKETETIVKETGAERMNLSNICPRRWLSKICYRL